MSKDLVFIASGGRTDTMFLGRQLGEIIPDAYSVHEPDIFHGLIDRRTWKNVRRFGLYHILIGRILKRTGARILGRAYALGELSHEQAVAKIRKSRAKYFAGLSAPLIIESNGQWTHLLPPLRNAFPEAKIICISRREEAWVRSWVNRGNRYTGHDKAGGSRLTPVELGEMDGATWDAMSSEERIRWEWRYTDDLLRNFAKKRPVGAAL